MDRDDLKILATLLSIAILVLGCFMYLVSKSTCYSYGTQQYTVMHNNNGSCSAHFKGVNGWADECFVVQSMDKNWCETQK